MGNLHSAMTISICLDHSDHFCVTGNIFSHLAEIFLHRIQRNHCFYSVTFFHNNLFLFFVFFICPTFHQRNSGHSKSLLLLHLQHFRQKPDNVPGSHTSFSHILSCHISCQSMDQYSQRCHLTISRLFFCCQKHA